MSSFARKVIDMLNPILKPSSTASRMDSLDELPRAKDQNASMKKIDIYLDGLCSYGHEMDRLTDSEKRVWYVLSLVSRVIDIGFAQYYQETQEHFAHQAVHALIEISAFKAAHIVRQENELFPNGQVPTEQPIHRLLSDQIELEVTAKWESLDNQFLDCNNEIDAHCIAFIKKHQSEF